MYCKKVVSWFSVVAILISWNNSVKADMDVQISGFLTAIATQTKNEKDATYNNGVATKDVETGTRDNHVGIQFASVIDPQIDITAQFISRGGYENYALETDWAYVNYKPLANVKFRIGKYKVPQFIASDYQDVGYAYPWVRPPQDVYGTNPLIALNGVDLSYKFNFGSSKLFFDLFYGDGRHKSFVPARTADFMGQDPTVTLTDEEIQDLKGKPIEFDTNKTAGFAAKYSARSFTLRAGYFETKVDVDADLGSAGRMTMNNVLGTFGGVGFTMDVKNIVAYSEFIRRDTDPEMANAFPDQDAWYATLGVRLGKLLPSITYSEIKPGVDKSDLAIEETSTAVDMRYDIGKTAAIKLEAMYVKPKEGNHGLFYEPVKDGKVYTASFDVIF